MPNSSAYASKLSLAHDDTFTNKQTIKNDMISKRKQEKRN